MDETTTPSFNPSPDETGLTEGDITSKTMGNIPTTDLDFANLNQQVAAHWAQAAPEKYKLDYHDFVTAHERPHSRVPYPNYSVGTRGLPFDDQKVGDGRYRGSGLY